jgi:hypothetical protein
MTRRFKPIATGLGVDAAETVVGKPVAETTPTVGRIQDDRSLSRRERSGGDR